ncbi:MAG: type II toxin-antitoxin system VapC family toxin [Actinomycetota bacterium]|nr:type II toxin-antitoxin system VapC family toxin [Actinomycetota bacterium]
MTALLLDTHVALWMVAEPQRLGVTTHSAIARLDNDVMVSVASVWEASIKAAQGRLRAPATLWDELERSGVRVVPIERADAVVAAALPMHHCDPFDRMLIAQAQERSAVLVTLDGWAGAYDVRTLSADL